MIEHLRQYAAVRAFLEAAALGDREAYLASLDALDWPTAWIDVFRGVVALGRVHPDTRLVFVDQWEGNLGEFIVYPPAGIRFRRLFAGHLDLLVDGLRILLPPLLRGTPRAIFRGQSVAEHEAGIVGLSWSPYATVAEQYARDPILNQTPCVVLVQFFPGDAIIGEINHSEFIVDPRKIKGAQVIQKPAGKFMPQNSGESYLGQCELIVLEELAPTSRQTIGT